MKLVSTLKRIKNMKFYSIEWRVKKVINSLKNTIKIPKKDYLNAGERYDPNLAGYYDPCHVKRYEFAISQIQENDTVLDIACGTGWGSNMVIDKCKEITGVDISRDDIKVANKKYKKNNTKFVLSDFFKFNGRANVVISFETLEHLKAVSFDEILTKLYSFGNRMIIGSVPYEEVPGNNPHHISFELNESDFNFLKDKGTLTFLYQDSKGLIHESKDSIKPQNLIFTFKFNSN